MTDYRALVTEDDVKGFRLVESLGDLYTLAHERLAAYKLRDSPEAADSKYEETTIEYIPHEDAIHLVIVVSFRVITERVELVLRSVDDLYDKAVLLNKIKYLTTRVESLEKVKASMRVIQDAAPIMEERLARLELMLGWASIHTFQVQIRYDDTRYLRSYKPNDNANNCHSIVLHETYSEAWAPVTAVATMDISNWIQNRPHLTEERCSSIYLLFRYLEVVTIEDRPWFDLGLLRNSPGIIKLTLVNLEKLKTVELLAGNDHLRFLTIVNCRGIGDLRVLLGCVSLELLTVDRVTNVGVFENEHRFAIEFNA